MAQFDSLNINKGSKFIIIKFCAMLCLSSSLCDNWTTDTEYEWGRAC